jgi:glycosyltransferase involved in cell wall biosynthesis
MKISPQRKNPSNPMVCKIVIPVYNGGKHLAKTLECAATQSYPQSSVLICDNGSTDQSAQVIQDAIQSYGKKMTCISRPNPSGMVNDWNLAIQDALKTNPDAIKLLPADDILSQDCIQQQVQALQENPDLGAVFCPKNIIDDKNQTHSYPWKFPHRILTSGDIKEILFTPSNWLGEPGSALIPAPIWKETGEFNTDFPYYGDLEYWIRILFKHPAKIVGDNTYWFRTHASSLTGENNKKAQKEACQLAEAQGVSRGIISPKDIPKIRRRAWLISQLRKIHNIIFK